MTHTVASVVASAPADDTRFCASSPGRLIGLDLACGPAILGMCAAHVGPDPSVGGRPGRLPETARGRSATLFRRGSLEYLLHTATEPARLIT